MDAPKSALNYGLLRVTWKNMKIGFLQNVSCVNVSFLHVNVKHYETYVK